MNEEEKRPRFCFTMTGPITFNVTGPAMAVIALLVVVIGLLVATLINHG